MVALSLGYRRAHYHLREQGWEINPKRVQRLWRDEGLRVPVRTRKRRRLGDSTTPAKRLRADTRTTCGRLTSRPIGPLMAAR